MQNVIFEIEGKTLTIGSIQRDSSCPRKWVKIPALIRVAFSIFSMNLTDGTDERANRSHSPDKLLIDHLKAW